MNEFRKFLGLKRMFTFPAYWAIVLNDTWCVEFKTFEDWNSDKEIAVRGHGRHGRLSPIETLFLSMQPNNCMDTLTAWNSMCVFPCSHTCENCVDDRIGWSASRGNDALDTRIAYRCWIHGLSVSFRPGFD